MHKTTTHPRPMLTIIIFSKDRACQLDSLLSSIRDHLHVTPVDIIVLFKASDASFLHGYQLLRSRKILPAIRWQQEQDFKTDLTAIINAVDKTSLLMFLVDDDIVFRPCSIDIIVDSFTEKHLFISLRTDRRYAHDSLPVFIKESPFLEWKWNYSKRRKVTWNYPFSVDGTIFHAHHLKRALRGIRFKAPNSLEGSLHSYRHRWWVKRRPLALAHPHACVFNNPLNKVQTEGETWHENITPESLNETYLGGKRIDNNRLYETLPDATHFFVPLSFTKNRNGA